MSILLEALRKSEKNQHLRETPSIHTENQADPVSESLPTGMLVLLLVAALFVSGFFVWRQYQPPAGSYQPPVTLAEDPVGVEAGPVIKDQDDVEEATTSPQAHVSSGKERTPVEAYESTASTEGLSKRTAPESGAASNKPGEGKKTRDSRLAFKPATRPGRKESHVKPTTTEEPVEDIPEKYHPGEPAPIGYWELPDAVRADIPEIKFSVLVYAANSADRFVLINGQRLEEGDTVQPGLEVREIRRDGVIFSYRLYRFLVER